MPDRRETAAPADPRGTTRRGFLRTVGAATLALSWTGVRAGPGEGRFSAMLSIAGDGAVHFTVPCAEMGQGIAQALAAAVMDELDADWSQLAVHYSGADTAFNNPLKGYQAVGGSQSVRGYYRPLRELGAMARQLLVQTAGERWAVPVGELTTENGRVMHARTGRKLSYGDLSADAAKQPLPQSVELKSPEDFRYLGHRVAGHEVGAIVEGRCEYGIDVRIPGMLYAALRQTSRPGAALQCTNADAIRALPGVRDVVTLPPAQYDVAHRSAVVVVADTFWQAKIALDAAEIDSVAPSADENSSAEPAQASRSKPVTVTADADASELGEGAAIDVEYRVPYVAHAAMEPLNCTAWTRDGGCELWAPTQGPHHLVRALSAALEIPPEKITIHRMRLGGGFGRRWNSDFGVQSARISATVGKPVQLIWTREEDVRHDFFRPTAAMRFKAAVSPEAGWTALDVNVTTASILDSERPGMLAGRPDPMVGREWVESVYRLPPKRVRWTRETTPVRLGLWRSVGHSFGGFFCESAVDECAHAAGQDPYRFRRALLEDSPRALAVLDKAAEMIGWDSPVNDGVGKGIAVIQCYESFVAHAAEVRVVGDELQVDRLVCAADCGQILSRSGLTAQFEGGTLFGLSAALFEEVPMNDGGAQVSNFHDYRVLRISDAPEIEVHLRVSHEDPGGGGEPPVPTVAPALTNAIFAASGRRVRSLPLARAFTIKSPARRSA